MNESADAVAAVRCARDVIARAAHHLAASGVVDDHQLVAYDLGHAAAGVEIAGSVAVEAGGAGNLGDDVERRMADAFVAEAIHDLACRLLAREEEWGVAPGALDPVMPFVRAHRCTSFLVSLAGQEGPRHLDADFELVRDTYRRFADDRVRPIAEHVHRHNTDIPEEVIAGLAELGTFGLSIPEAYGGFASGGGGELLAMVVATEELSRASLGVAGSLVTRPEILAQALLQGATESQKRMWLPRLASGDQMVAVAVTEPDTGSDSGAVTTSATRTEDGGSYVLHGVKTWCTFAGRADLLMVLARTDPDRSLAHRGLSLFVVPKDRAAGHHFRLEQPDGGRLDGRAIDTLGYRGMHSFEVSFDGWRVPADHLVGGDAGVGNGFYLQMAGFDTGRLQTAARAIGVMQAAYEAARDYVAERRLFGRHLGEFQLTQARLVRMAVVIHAARQFMYVVARLLARGTGEGVMEAAMVKAYTCRAAEWVTREAMQLHGGMGYAEEYPVSRYFVDARVLSIFEGADEVLAMKVIARRLSGERPMIPPQRVR
jgi:(2S)-methylsuccinyl-CoA dehydrogenase